MRKIKRTTHPFEKAPIMPTNEAFIREVEKQAAYDKGMREGIRVSVSKVSAAFVINLHENHKFGPKKMARLMKEVTKTFALIDDGTVDLEDLVAEAERCGVKLKTSNPAEGQRAANKNGG